MLTWLTGMRQCHPNLQYKYHFLRHLKLVLWRSCLETLTRTLHLMQLLTGMRQSVRPGSGCITLNVDVASTPVYESGPLPDFMVTRMGLQGGVEAVGKLRAKDFDAANKVVTGKWVSSTCIQIDSSCML
jgi:hypothetical protein